MRCPGESIGLFRLRVKPCAYVELKQMDACRSLGSRRKSGQRRKNLKQLPAAAGENMVRAFFSRSRHKLSPDSSHLRLTNSTHLAAYKGMATIDRQQSTSRSNANCQLVSLPCRHFLEFLLQNELIRLTGVSFCLRPAGTSKAWNPTRSAHLSALF